MGIQLYEHNSRAYESALTMLAETGRAAVIHPTGTGKSFIGFRLCEDLPDKRVCWLSPSAYIFRTQLDNLRAASDGYAPRNIVFNIVFYTYARLMRLGEAIARSILAPPSMCCRHMPAKRIWSGTGPG